jgi:hypothetical protein
MKSTKVTVGTTATLIIPSDNLNRWVYIHNGGGAKIYLGGSGVTTTTGFHVANNESAEFFLPEKETLYAIVASSTNDIIVLTPDTD